jgi:hypothetical protein
MHTDEDKKFDRRNVASNIRTGLMTKRDYELYLSKLPDVSEKVFLPEESPSDSVDVEAKRANQVHSGRKKTKKRGKGN